MTHRKTLLLGIVLVGIAVAVLHGLAAVFSLYWMYPWFDVLMHFLGGMFTAFLMLWLAHGAKERGFSLAAYPYRRPSAMLLFAVVLTLLGAASWEVFEVWAGNPQELNYQFDTALDIFMGVVGGIATVLWLHVAQDWRTSPIIQTA